MAQPLYQIKDIVRYHKVIYFSSNYTLYADLSNRVVQALSELVPAFEVYSIDEAFIDFTGIEPKELSTLGRKIVKMVRRWTGIPVSLGIGPTKTLAKVANHIAKKGPQHNNLFILNEINREKCLMKMPVEEVWGIGRRWTKKLYMKEIINAYQLSLMNIESVQKMSNKVLAATVSELKGQVVQDIQELNPPKKQIVVSRSFGKPVTEIKALKEAVSAHLSRAMEKLRKQSSVAQYLSVFIQTDRFKSNFQGYHYQQDIKLALPSHDTQEFIKLAIPAVERLFCKGLDYKKAGVILSDISQIGQGQFDLFAENTAQKDSFMELMDQINRKMGKGKLRYAIEGHQKGWQMRASKRSQRYTTCWKELLIVKAN
jgi:DNA polymerase V